MELFQVLYVLGIFLGPFMAGALSQQTGFVTVFYLAGELALVGMLLSFHWYQKEVSHSLFIWNLFFNTK
ncbi:hypothetical protein [Bacillus taeanensis]|uniref:Major facilitator superfamily (MFS) profile domain-containing protein n=1 Tax=Bacillus taeanensis TaxID=273032 RepID=A0A366XTM2_9BACI|nr:hypothetical protein [Bacillus taeanensis]RBW68495.1 hypothetical protein DS031_16085 [Bacillus taeanensis]